MSNVADMATDEVPVVRAVHDFESFYRLSYDHVARALGATLRDRHLGGEAADEAMARCFANWASVSQYDNPAGWVYRVGLNWARSAIRKLRRNLPAPDRPWVEPEDVADPAIARALAQISMDQRAVIVCRFLLDWSIAQTATALGVREGTVKSRTSRALKALELALEDAR